MQISVNLQSSILAPIFFMAVIILILIGITTYILLSKKRKKVEKVIEIKEINVTDGKKVQQKYLKIIDELSEKIQNNQMDIRSAYQNLSSIIRNFVYEMTNIKVQNYTLKEIKKVELPMLYELIKEYYNPEFAKKSLGDIKSSIDKTRKVIEKWN